MLTYNGALNTDAQFMAQVNEYNHAFSIFIKQETRARVKRKVAENVVHRLTTIDTRLMTDDPAWLDIPVQAISGTNRNYQALLHRRILLGNFREVQRILIEINVTQDLLNMIERSITLHERIIINRENGLNMNFGSAILETVELIAAGGVILGMVTMGVGFIGMGLRLAGFFGPQVCATVTTATATTTGATAATTEGTILFGGSVIAGTSHFVRGIASNAREQDSPTLRPIDANHEDEEEQRRVNRPR
ncbi:MAG: hypothetical protein LRY67_06520 [Gammaproteobacteria bacterium]|nr:hypothetical protein [Gammaproteobacteria bacterium]MCD8543106.1 hypothetical protein [Gammaproteobacteria bacterium]